MTARRTQQAHTVVGKVLGAGDTAVDATAGNGHDTLFLCERVGKQGRVFGFDVQATAIAATQHRLEQLPDSARPDVTLYEASHADMEKTLPATVHGRVNTVMFNLGFLPGGDHALTTLVDATMSGIRAATVVLAPDGLLSVLAYPGHPAGREELERLVEYMYSSETPLSWHEHDPRAAPDRAPRLFIGR